MRVLLIGSGGREHALAVGLAADPSVEFLAAAPGNPGIAQVAELHEVTATDPAAVAALAVELAADLVVVGPEAPLVAGVADAVRAKGIACFGPSAAAALGPKQAMPLARTASATPATSGASGPTTTRSAASSTASAATAAGSVAVTGKIEATCAMPGLPGAAARKSTDGSAARPTARACSRPPDPIRSTRTAADPTGAVLPHVAPQVGRVNFGSTRASPRTRRVQEKKCR